MSRYALVLVLSVLAAWLGTALGGRDTVGHGQGVDSTGPTSPGRVGHAKSSGTEGKIPSAREKIRGVLGRTDTEALWEQLLSKEVSSIVTVTDVALLDELIDREGLGAWKRLLGLPAGEQRSQWCGRLLERYGYKDPWLAYEMFLNERGSFPEGWGREAGTAILMGAARISADKYIEVMDEFGFNQTMDIFFAEFPPGFDFGKLVRHFEVSEFRAAGVPGNLVSSWAAVSPLEAAEYLSGLKRLPVTDEEVERGLLDRQGFIDLPDILKAVAGSKDESKNEALAQLAGLPAGELQRAWENRAERDQGKLIPEMLDAASVMGQRDDYLVSVLLNTWGQRAPDVSWKLIPQDERRRLLDLAEKHWEDKANTPFEKRARERWRAMIEEAWVKASKK